jgi:glutathione S-transferase
VRDLFWGLVRTPPEKRDPDVLRKAQAEGEKSFAILDEHLSRRRYVAGDSFTMGDIPVGTFAYRWFTLDIERPEQPHLRQWYERLTERPGFREHVMLPLT